MVLTLIVCMDVLTEEMPRYPTAVAVLAQRGHLGRLAGRLFYPGWASGVLFSTLLCGMVLSIMAGITWKSASWDWDDGPFPHLICLFLAVFVPVILRINRTNTFVNWWVVQLCSVILGIMLMMFCFTMNARDLGVLGMFTPITALFGVECVNYSSRGSILFLGCLFSVIWLVVAMVRAASNFSTYTTLESEALEQAARETHRTHDAA